MGTTNSKNSKQHKIQHQRFQDAKIVSSDQIQILVRTTLDDYNTWKSNLKKMGFANKENILFPLNHSFQEEGWCSQNTGFVKITYDNYPFVFQEQLQNRISLDKHLSQQEMWYLLYTLVSTAKDFSFMNRKVGDIRPHNIFVNEAGQIKLAVCFSWPNQPNNFQKTTNQKQITYLSPEEMQICKNNKMQSIVNVIVSESFSIGLTMLHAGLLFNFSSIYNLQKFQINKKLLDEKIQSWMDLEFLDDNHNKTSYSSSLKQIVRNLCIFDHQTRQKSTQIFNLLQPHKQAILNIEPFELKYKGSPNNPQPQLQIGHYNPLQKSIGFPIYNYAQLSKHAPSIQTPVPVNPINYDWSTRPFTQVPFTNNISPITTNYNYELFDKYANSSIHSPSKIGQVNIKLTNTMNQKQSIENKPAYYTQASSNPGAFTVRPFMSINDDVHQNNVFRPISIGPLEGHIQKKVQSKDFIQYGTSNQDKQITFNRVQVETTIRTNNNNSSDFLRKIDEQIQKSKSMFPS